MTQLPVGGEPTLHHAARLAGDLEMLMALDGHDGLAADTCAAVMELLDALHRMGFRPSDPSLPTLTAFE